MSRFLTVVAVGDRASHKTDLLETYTGYKHFNKRFEGALHPTFENNIQDIIVDGVPWSVYFIDAECDDAYEMLRSQAYEKADCILLCYAVDEEPTFAHIYEKWCIQVRQTAPNTPLILVGTGIEKRGSNNNNVTLEQGENLKLLIGADALIECSIPNFLGIDDVFIEAVRSTYKRNC